MRAYRHPASLLRVPNALCAWEETAGRQGRRFVRGTTRQLVGGSTCLVPFNVLARYGFNSAALRRSA